MKLASSNCWEMLFFNGRVKATIRLKDKKCLKKSWTQEKGKCLRDRINAKLINLRCFCRYTVNSLSPDTFVKPQKDVPTLFCNILTMLELFTSNVR